MITHKVVLLFLTLILASTASAFDLTSPESVIQKLIDLENAQQWSQIPELWIDSERDTYRVFIAQPGNKENNVGLFNIRGAKLVGIKELPNDLAHMFTYWPKYSTVYPSMKAYYVAVDYKVAKDTRSYFNKINYFVVLIVQQRGQWKLAQFSTAPVHAIVKKGHGFDTEDEKKAAPLYQQRENGKSMEG